LGGAALSSEISATSGLAPIALRDGLIIGRGADASAVLPDASVSRRHALLRRTESGWRVEDLGSRSGTFLNGRLFKAEELVFGDLLRIGPFSLRFDGRFLLETAGTTGARLEARDLKKSALGISMLSEVSLSVAPCQFVGVIGPSGAGKSTLLDALCALRPADSGSVIIDGMDLYANYEAMREELGYVPQDDIVPLELSIEQALFFSARLRLPRRTPAAEIRKLVWHTMRLLGLEERAHTPVGKLSGGQRKRVSVGAELLCRPRLMFLDEPTSGLDPAAEFRLMESFRHLAVTGCTILCTTHVLGNAFLFDRLAVMYGGNLVFFGEPANALEYFGVERLTLLYDSLSHRQASDWPAHREGPFPPATARALPQRHKRSAALPILLLRHWAIFRADWKNLFIALGQPIFIGLLVTWVSKEPPLVLFFAYIATLWFGCGNAAQEIVKELPMFRRERLIGLGRHAYLLSEVPRPGPNHSRSKFAAIRRDATVHRRHRWRCGLADSGAYFGFVRRRGHRTGNLRVREIRLTGCDDRSPGFDSTNPFLGICPAGRRHEGWTVFRFQADAQRSCAKCDGHKPVLAEENQRFDARGLSVSIFQSQPRQIAKKWANLCQRKTGLVGSWDAWGLGRLRILRRVACTSWQRARMNRLAEKFCHIGCRAVF
jgi:ABC-type multidrug transport system ATPase subunit